MGLFTITVNLLKQVLPKKKKNLKQPKGILKSSLTGIIRIFKNTQTVHLGKIIWCEPLIICKLIQFIYLSTQPFIRQTAVEFYYMPRNKLYSPGDEHECTEYKYYGSYPKAIYSWATSLNLKEQFFCIKWG